MENDLHITDNNIRMKSGKVKFYNSESGYGFIVPENGEKDIFFHTTDVDAEGDLKEDDHVDYEEGEGKKGLKAVGVKLHDSVNNY